MPILCVGRMQRRAEDGWWHDARSLRGETRLYGLDLVFLIVPAIVFGVLAGAGRLPTTLAMTAWVFALLTTADLLDRLVSDVRFIWLSLWAIVVPGLTAPLWLAPLFGQTAVAPAIATWSIGLHPAATVLGASGLPTLQDPLFYHLTLSGVVEVRPLWWGWGTLFFLGITMVTLAVCFLVRRGHNAAHAMID